MKRLIDIIFCFIPICLWGQPLDSLLSKLPDNRAYQALEYERLALEQRIEAADVWPEPMASSSWFALPIETRLGPQILRVGASQDIPWKGALDNKRALAANQALIPDAEKEELRASLGFELSAAWYELVAVREKITLAEEELEWLRRRIELVRDRVANGMAGMDDLFLLESEAEGVMRKIQVLRESEGIPEARINGILSRAPGTEVATPEVLSPPAWEFEDKPDLSDHPSLVKWDLRAQEADLRIDQNTWDRRPFINAGLDYIIVGKQDQADPPGNGRDILAPRVGIRLPIAGEKYRSRAQEEQMRKEMYASRKELGAINLRTNWEIAQNQYTQAELSIGSLDRQIEWAERSLPVTIVRWTEGKAGMEEVLGIHRRIRKLKQEKADLKWQQARAVARARELLTKKYADHGMEDK